MAKPHVRLRTKTMCDVHGRPVLPNSVNLCIAKDIFPLPVVVSAADVRPPAEVSTVSAFENEYGHLVRSITEYRGLGAKALRSALANRSAIDLTTGKWADTPVLVSSEKVIRNWVDKFGNDNQPGIQISIGSHQGPIATPGDLEDWCGGNLRRYVALGFSGRRAVQKYLREHGIIVGEWVVHKWLDLHSRWTPEQESAALYECPADCLDRYGHVRTTNADLCEYERDLQVWHRVWGLSVQQVVHRFQSQLDCEYKGVSCSVVWDFFQRNPLRVFESWQLLLQGRVATYLVELKARYPYIGPRCIYWNGMHHQPFLRKKLWEEFAVRCDFQASDLYKVWDYVCRPDEPYAAVMPCSKCGYLFPEPKVVVERGYSRNRDGAFVWTCEYCVADGGLCKEACILSYRTKWRQTPEDNASWRRRYSKRSHMIDIESSDIVLHNKHFSEAAFQKSLAALYARREVAREFGCRGTLNQYADFGDKWLLHDEIFHRHGYDVPVPYFMQNANRAAWLRIPESALSERDRISEFEMGRDKAAAAKRKQVTERAEYAKRARAAGA